MGRRTVVLFIIVISSTLGMHFSCSNPPEGSPDWYFNNAYDLANRGLYEEAVQEYTKVLENNPTNTIELQTYINRAAANYSLERWDEAISDATAAIDLDSENTLAYLNRAMAYNAAKEHDLAIADFSIIIMLDDSIAEVYVRQASAYISKEEFQRALDDCNTALEIDPEQTYAYFNRGLAYKGLGQTEEAISDFENFIALTDSPTWIEMATQEINELLEVESESAVVE